MRKINVICEVRDGHLECPFLFVDEDEAGKCFEAIVKKEKFREKRKNEPWLHYAEAFYTWYESDDYPSDRMDFEIHWYKDVELKGEIDVNSAKEIIRASTDEIAIFWHLNDVKDRAEENEINLTDDQAKEVLHLMESKHDCNYGITWEAIDSYIDQVKNPDSLKIKVLVSNIMSVIDIDRKCISEATFNYLNNNFVIYRDEKLKEHLISLQDAQEDIEIDKEWIKHNDHAKSIEQEVRALIKEANKSDAAYVRFISGEK